MKSSKITTILMLLIIVIFLIYAGYYILQTSHVIDGTRYFNLNDDAMISMRFAKNLANGYGAVWNPGGEHVEGYSNPLWVVYMAIFHLFPISPANISLPIQITGALLMIINMFLVLKITQTLTDKLILILGAVILTGFYGPLVNWSLLGMEVSILVVMINWAALLVIRNLEKQTFSIFPYLILGIGTLVRFDMGVPLLLFTIYLTVADKPNRKKHLVWGLGFLAGFLFLQTGLRLWYYGAPLPNTYYLKVTGTPLYVRIGKGLYALGNLIWRTNWIIALLPFTILAFRRDKTVSLLLLIFIGQAAYSVYVGGDAWEHMGGANRYISLGISAFFILLVIAIGYLFEILTTPLKNKPKWTATLANLGLIAFLVTCLITTNYRINNNSLLKWLALKPPEFSVASKDYIQIAHAVQKITAEEALIAIQSAGTIPYHADRPAHDLWGKIDTVIAHSDSHLKPGLNGIIQFRPGHTKWDAMYSVVELQPDLLVQLDKDPNVTNPKALEYVEEYYLIIEIDGYSFTARADSPYILWDAADNYYPTP